MKIVFKYLLLGFATMFLFTYTTSLFDDAFRKTGTYKDVLGSFRYYVFWVLPYWWSAIIVGTILLALLYYNAKKVIEDIIRRIKL